MQIQDSFGGLTLAELGSLGLGIYLRIPDFKKACPLCGGAGCAVRHGLYYRLVVDLEGLVIERFPIPRFRCLSFPPGVFSATRTLNEAGKWV